MKLFKTITMTAIGLVMASAVQAETRVTYKSAKTSSSYY